LDFFIAQEIIKVSVPSEGEEKIEPQSTQRGRAATKYIHHRGHRDHREISQKKRTKSKI